MRHTAYPPTDELIPMEPIATMLEGLVGEDTTRQAELWTRPHRRGPILAAIEVGEETQTRLVAAGLRVDAL